MAEQLTVAISGSFKFKPEIDALHDEFADYGATVLEPAKGWLYIPSRQPSPITDPKDFRQLPNERGLGIVEVEERFLSAIKRADFVYLFNKYHYLGTSVALETGFAYGHGVPVFALNELTLENLDYELDSWKRWSNRIILATPRAAVEGARILKDLRASLAHRPPHVWEDAFETILQNIGGKQPRIPSS